MTIKVTAPGLATTVQDLGRPGYYHLGIPISGAMDRFALRAANLLVGNDENAAGLEAVFMGPELEFTTDATVAVCGAELPPKVDGTPAETWTSFQVKAGQVIEEVIAENLKAEDSKKNTFIAFKKKKDIVSLDRVN